MTLQPGQRLKIIKGKYKSDGGTGTFFGNRGFTQAWIKVDGMSERVYVSRKSIEPITGPENETRTLVSTKRANRSAPKTTTTVEVDEATLNAAYNRVNRLENEVKELKKELEKLSLK